ncbi:DUF4974 domain-containing protein [Sphingobacterium sp. SRCM116780]|uniref:FecR family protein n=1 Tax=Sphingobacterium sp. SRCM116780 TaxID=2907623 RepID=UPI001F30A433|nr:FecR family protein [Sphingobacterium sp. SRCM116780]UIR54897.1 DUF4974 domain-containing protein [Sphingobacterium sp. SRCM116780]
MEKEKFIQIASRVADGVATPEEIAQYIYYLDWSAQHSSLWNEVPLMDKTSFQESIRLNLSQQFQTKKSIPFYKKTKWIAAAAMLLAIGTCSIMFYKSLQSTNYSKENIQASTIKPGQQKATLTLANGKKIVLNNQSDGQVLTDAGVEIVKESNGQLVYRVLENQQSAKGDNTLSTQRGETYSVVLLDGTKVWLNASSSLTYSTLLYTEGKRKVKIEGEAYFEVSKDALHPFIVQSENQEVEVLGTHFNVDAYPEDKVVRTTLLEGQVAVKSGREKRILRPNQQISNYNHQLSVQDVDGLDAVAWKNGKFVFHQESMESIMQKISRWYDVDIDYQNEELKKVAFTGTIAKYDRIEKVLSKLALTEEVKFSIQKNTIVVNSN